jgi:Domain of unknown function (DUF4145)
MVGSAKDTPEVIEFMALFAQLKEWSDDAPDELADLAKRDESIRQLCEELRWAGQVLKRKERSSKALFAAPVDPTILTSWRDYEARYEQILTGIWFDDLFGDLGPREPSQTPESERDWQITDDIAEEQALAVQAAIDFANTNANDLGRGLDPNQIFEVQYGISVWDDLKDKAGFDLRGFLRRRELVPFVLIPRRVAARYGDAERLSLLKNLKQAHEAFNCGAFHAALALMRSIIEAALKDHYGAQGKWLWEMIDDPAIRLPKGASVAALHRLRMLANAAVHLGNEKTEGLREMDDVTLEKEVLSLLFVVRALIEGAR